MKIFIKIMLYILLTSSIIFIYNLYFKSENKVQQSNLINKNKNSLKDDPEIIKNLKYELKLNDENIYIIKSKVRRIDSINNRDLVNMEIVSAVIKNNKKNTLIITSDKAVFDKANFNSHFTENVKIEYLDNTLYSDEVLLMYTEKVIDISNNVSLVGPKISMKTDKVRINLLTNKIDIFTHEPQKKIKVELKNNANY